MEQEPDALKSVLKNAFKRCAADPIFFITNFCYIQHPIKGKILFDMFEYQKDTLGAFEEHDFNIILKGRQIGISTLVAAYSIWLMMFHSDKNILVISKDQQTAKNLVTKVKVMNQMLPSWLRRELTENNKLTLRYANGSQIQAVARSKDAGRSEALSLLIIDEAAFIDEVKQIWTAAAATLATGGSAVLLSTPNGQGNFFHETWSKAVSKENNFNPIKLDWRVHPDRDQDWRDNQTRIMGEQEAIQEHDASFIFSGNTVIKPELIEFQKNTYCKEPIEKTYADRNLWIWEYAKPGRTYVLSADVARGDGADYSAFHIIDLETMNQVAEYKGKIPPETFGTLMVQWAIAYNNALVIPENQTIGWAAIQQVINLEYRNLFYMSKDMQVVDVHQQYAANYYRNDKTLIPGFTTSAKTRPMIIAKLDEYIRDNSIVIRSLRTIHELESFIWKNGKAEASSGKNDDLIIALCIGLWVRDTALRLKNEYSAMTQATAEHFRQGTMPFVQKEQNEATKSWTFKTGQGIEDISWLIK